MLVDHRNASIHQLLQFLQKRLNHFQQVLARLGEFLSKQVSSEKVDDSIEDDILEFLQEGTSLVGKDCCDHRD